MRYGRGILLGIIVLCILVEVFLKLGDLGLFGIGRVRQTVYEYAGFWPGLLTNWIPNYRGQTTTMFVTYGFLHGGVLHLIVNMATLWSLGNAVLKRVGTLGFVLLYAGALVGGAIGYSLLAPGFRPMVGASGALFGLAGGLLAWQYVDRYTFNQGLWPIAQATVLLIGLNLILWWAMEGQLAWETHLGGFVTGWLAATLIDPRPGRKTDGTK